MPTLRSVKIPESAYQKAHHLREVLLQAGVTHMEDGKVVPMTLGRVVEEGLDLLAKVWAASPPKRKSTTVS